MARVAFLGLGVMGYPMAGHLAAKGHDVTVFNRTEAKAKAWCDAHGGTHGDTPKTAAKGNEIVFACVGNDDDLRSVCLGEHGAFAGMEAGTLFVDHTTVSAQVTKELAEAAAERGIAYVDAPVSGGQAGAENGQLVVMCGGAQADYDRAEGVIAAYAKACRRMGEVGAGQLTKMVNQICIAGLLQGLSEGLTLAEKAGLDGEAVIDVIQGGAAGSWQMVNRHKTMLAGEYEHGFAVDWMRKDLAICLAAGEDLGAPLPATALIDQFYKDVQAMGGGRWDTSSLMARLGKLAG
ncbi:NAD(P)-dependent oxidoreductase [Jannaschia sp. Os4]|uniref:NAD(P)-dependent oxidoreductase n=1 Tax=Jannaschia sp. Os4 TaxID=2807617 RepID=UPI00193A0026|nr:NAD(P)-dependent oxidoreductase [Jannaschia sp. Os4]MBM2577081.1 NAD(P)-dependent oxidoreductase [Jannaschia sp. Os4]